MTFNLETAFHPRLVNYTPKSLTSEQWLRFREPVCSLVTRANPASDKDAKRLVWVLTQLMAAGLSDQSQAGFEELISGVAITRHINQLRSERNTSTASKAQALLGRLRDVHEQLPPKPQRTNRPITNILPSDVAFEPLRGQISQAPVAVRLALERALTLGLAAGFSWEQTRTARIVITETGEVKVEQAGWCRPALETHVPALLGMHASGQNLKPRDFRRARIWWRENVGKWPEIEIRRHWTRDVVNAMTVGSETFRTSGLKRKQMDLVLDSVTVNLADYRDLIRGM